MGKREVAVLLHGSNVADPAAIWQKQQELTSEFDILVPERRGYGQSADAAHADFEGMVADVIAQIWPGAHLVGHSYGAVVAMLAAAKVPERILSLVLIEPPAYQVARGIECVDRLVELMMPVYADSTTPEVFARGFVKGLTGEELPEPFELAPAHRKALLSTMREPVPWKAELPLDALAEAAFSKMLVTGGWHPAFEAVGDALSRAIGAERVAFPNAGHGVAARVENFNDVLREIWNR